MTESPSNSSILLRKIRSFVRRDSRMTDAQRRAKEDLWPKIGLELEHGLCDFAKIFERHAPRILEIGFGSGQSLLTMAKTHPDQDFIGIETHLPGIGALLLGMQLQEINNIRIYYADAVEVLNQCIPQESLDVIQIFFPDPWPKRKHHKRRLIQENFVNCLISKLKRKGTLHLATDWEDYAVQMMQVLSSAQGLSNRAGAGQYSNRSSQRPIVTKFERRGTEAGRQIWELQFTVEK
jgi:tRNA (guanine-N7-)-methyltransferase